jgi:ATP:ADP antiporter, AAA family
MTADRAWVDRIVPANPAERAAALWSFSYFFTLLACYYVLRPLRDQMGIAGGVRRNDRRSGDQRSCIRTVCRRSA